MSWRISARKLPVNGYTEQCRSAVVAPTIYAATRPRPLCESSFWTSKEVQETSRNPAARPRRTQRYRLGALFSSPSHVTARDLAGVYDVTGGRLSSVYGRRSPDATLHSLLWSRRRRVDIVQRSSTVNDNVWRLSVCPAANT